MSKTTILFLLAVATSVALVACGEAETTGRRVVLRTRITSDATAGTPFTASSGWTITLDRALIATGTFYYYDGPPAIAARRGPARWLAALSPIATAHAHPGHYDQGRTRGQMLSPSSADLLAGPAMLEDGAGVTGSLRSGSFSFGGPSAGPVAAALGGETVLVAGRATRGEATVHFQMAAKLADIARSAREGVVPGCPFEPADVEADGTVTLTVRPRVWFNLVDFSDLAPGTPAAPTVIAPEHLAHIGFVLGLAQLGAYRFSFTTP